MSEVDMDTVHQLDLVPLGEDAWRLCDRSVDSCDATSVVAYVERRDDGYEVVWVSTHRGVERFTTMGDALERAAEVLSAVTPPGATRPIPIPHFAPRPAALAG
ncbi:hypothetical protein [Microbacterium petrolearium]